MSHINLAFTPDTEDIMTGFFTINEFRQAADFVMKKTSVKPRIGIVLGSGLGDFADSVTGADIIDYHEIPNWPVSSVKGHAGRLHIGWLEKQPVIVMRGRTHYYEGYPMTQITLPVRVMQLMGVELLMLTNAAGGINKQFVPGELMLINDQINFVGMGGANPLLGPNDDSLGPRFPDMSKIYDREIRETALSVARDNDIPLHQGIYAGLAGPSFESPAEVRFFRMIGVDAVGMSTTPEAITARHGGMKVMGVSSIANVAIDDPDSTAITTHDEVLEAGKVAIPRLITLLRGVLQRL
jgi:purine-nucleoside phosphorylase